MVDGKTLNGVTPPEFYSFQPGQKPLSGDPTDPAGHHLAVITNKKSHYQIIIGGFHDKLQTDHNDPNIYRYDSGGAELTLMGGYQISKTFKKSGLTIEGSARAGGFLSYNSVVVNIQQNALTITNQMGGRRFNTGEGVLGGFSGDLKANIPSFRLRLPLIGTNQIHPITAISIGVSIMEDSARSQTSVNVSTSPTAKPTVQTLSTNISGLYITPFIKFAFR